MPISNIKRMYERNFLAAIISDCEWEIFETIIPGFWDIVAEYFTHK